MKDEVAPHHIEENDFLLGTGLRGLVGYYHAFNSASYIAGVLSERAETAKGLEGKLAQNEAERIHTFAALVQISAWRMPESLTLFDTEEEIDQEREDYLSKLSQKLQSAKVELGELTTKTSKLWNAFYAQEGRNELEHLYSESQRILREIVYNRSVGFSEGYRQGLQILDQITSSVKGNKNLSRKFRSTLRLY